MEVLKSTKVKQQKVECSASDDSGSDEEEATNFGAGNSGWADSIAKVLNTTKPKTKKTLVLSRAKKNKSSSKSEKTETNYGFEIDGEINEKNNEKEEPGKELQTRKNQTLALRVKPSWQDMERERALRKIGTRGVVQLFNAVRSQQKNLKQQLEDAGPLESRREAVMNNINKRKFLDVLMNGSRSKSEPVDKAVKTEHNAGISSSEEDEPSDGKKKSEWNVLRTDFMTNKKIKHWDEEDNDSDNSAQNSPSENEDDD